MLGCKQRSDCCALGLLQMRVRPQPHLGGWVVFQFLLFWVPFQIGKWHLGHLHSLPTERGFDGFYGLPYPQDDGCPPECGALTKDWCVCVCVCVHVCVCGRVFSGMYACVFILTCITSLWFNMQTNMHYYVLCL